MRKVLPTSLRFGINSSKGFTLIELMVVIAIIAILATVGFTIYSGVQSKARDTKRQQDIKALANAFEVNKAQGAASYPIISASWFGGNVIPFESGYTSPATATYAIAYTTAAGCTVTKGTISWANTSAGPASSSFTMSPGACAVPTVVAPAGAPTGIVSFQICALLENGGANNAYCVPNSQ